MEPFIHLRVHSAYSLAEGAIQIKDLVKRCKLNHMPAVAVTDTNNLFGALEFAMAAADAGVQPIIGAQISMEDGAKIVLLAQSHDGYLNLCKLVSDGYMNGAGGKDFVVSYQQVVDNAKDVICLSGGPVSGVLDETRLKFLKENFGNRFYIELQRHHLAEENQNEPALIDFAYRENVPLVATNDCYFADPSMHEAHDALLCIAEGRYVTETDRRKVTKHHFFKSGEDMSKMFADIPEAIANTAIIAKRCHFLLKGLKPILPPFETSSGLGEVEELRKQAREGLQWRLENYTAEGTDPKPYEERLEFELSTIEKMGFPGYFLIVSDFIKWAKDHGIPVGPGRGSGAGSVVAWALKITDLDPLQFNLLFERFLNPERVSMPDFDVDFCQDRRDEVIKYVQDRYGKDRVAQIITFGKLQARNTVRDVGRVLQMPYGQVDRLAKMIPNNPANPITLQEALDSDADLRAERDKEETSQKLIEIALQLEGLYRHAGTHAAGVVISDRPLHELVPVYRDPRSEMPVTQFNMKYVEQAGLVKFDFLGLKTLTVVQKALELVKQTTGKDIDILQIPLDDAKSYEMISRGESTGVFQLESSGMKDTLRKMKPNRFEDIIALVALYRPGPMDNIPKYVSVKDGNEEADYLHPKLRPMLEETYGIMVYQEQVMQAAQILSGYTLGGADLLRRAMGKKIKSEMDAQQAMFVKGAAEHSQVPNEQAAMIFVQIEKFAGYGFNKSHAAAYALVAYQTAWLKANYPVEFMAASMTLDYGNTDKLAIFKQESQRMDIAIVPPDVNKSGVMFDVEDGKIRYALAALKGVGHGAMEKMVAERRENGIYKDLADFIDRLDAKVMNKKSFEQLICAGAFDSLYSKRAELYENMEILLRHVQAQADERASGQVSLFGDPQGAASLPPMKEAQEWDVLEKLRYEFDAVGFYLSAHPLDTKVAQMERMKIIPFGRLAEELDRRPSSRVQMAGILIKKVEKVSAKSGNKFAFLQMSDATGVYEVMIFSETLSRTRSLLEPGNALLLTCDADVKDEQVRLLGQIITPLDETLADKLAELAVHIDAPAPLKKISDLIAVEGRGGVKISVFAHMDDGQIAEVALNGRWSLSPAAIAAIRSTAGVIRIAER
ncbi:MAG: DNA polymerase III subunit alpha [Micavibrio aeruginosavorus]|uniref:DNA polymerase III subunit alpha n=1 Tax=Micavibrio aeruginosavorus TaxID=349221 RepID=A0A2W5MUJ5_9BACT|nr:MAG: DNA polymerase III subunit alpha [Micavibrio aeruginosavorus]